MKGNYLMGALIVCGLAACNNVKIREFTATPQLVLEGGAAQLEWKVSHGEKCTLHDFGEDRHYPVEPVGMKLVHPVITSTFEIGCRSDQYMEGNHRDLVVTVIPAEETSVFFGAAPSVVSPGDTVLLAWDTTFPDQCVLEPGAIPVDPPNGFLTVNPVEPTAYALTCWLDLDPAHLSKTVYATVLVTP